MIHISNYTIHTEGGLPEKQKLINAGRQCNLIKYGDNTVANYNITKKSEKRKRKKFNKCHTIHRAVLQQVPQPARI